MSAAGKISHRMGALLFHKMASLLFHKMAAFLFYKITPTLCYFTRWLALTKLLLKILWLAEIACMKRVCIEHGRVSKMVSFKCSLPYSRTTSKMRVSIKELSRSG